MEEVIYTGKVNEDGSISIKGMVFYAKNRSNGAAYLSIKPTKTQTVGATVTFLLVENDFPEGPRRDWHPPKAKVLSSNS
jgi:hypothetical protein